MVRDWNRKTCPIHGGLFLMISLPALLEICERFYFSIHTFQVLIEIPQKTFLENIHSLVENLVNLWSNSGYVFFYKLSLLSWLVCDYCFVNKLFSCYCNFDSILANISHLFCGKKQFFNCFKFEFQQICAFFSQSEHTMFSFLMQNCLIELQLCKYTFVCSVNQSVIKNVIVCL